MIEPLKPEDVPGYKKTIFPDFVLESFNELIAKNWNNGRAMVLQKDVVNLMSLKMPGESYSDNKNKIYAEGWLNVEDIYREAGWKVTYNKPGYNESYEASFEFKVK